MKKLLKNNWFIVGIIIILICFDIAIHIPIIDIKCNYFGAMISFIGILATFIVISNYVQVKDIKEETNKQISSMKTEFDKIKIIEDKMKTMNDIIENNKLELKIKIEELRGVVLKNKIENDANILFVSANEFKEKENYDGALATYCFALKKYVSIENDILIETTLDQIFRLMPKINTKKPDFKIPTELITMLSNLINKHPKAELIIDLLTN